MEMKKKKILEKLNSRACHRCGSNARELYSAGVCTTCQTHQESYTGAITAVLAGMCPVCYGLPHRRDAELCTWCNEPYAELPVEEIDAWAGYGSSCSEYAAPDVDFQSRRRLQRECPACNKVIYYTSESAVISADRVGTMCAGCTSKKRYEAVERVRCSECGDPLSMKPSTARRALRRFGVVRCAACVAQRREDRDRTSVIQKWKDKLTCSSCGGKLGSTIASQAEQARKLESGGILRCKSCAAKYARSLCDV